MPTGSRPLAPAGARRPAPQRPRPDQLVYLIELRSEDDSHRFHVDLSFGGSDRGACRLLLPRAWGGQEHLYQAIQNLRAISPDTRIADAAEPHVKELTHPPNQTVRVEYDLVQDWPGSAVKEGLHHRVILQSDHFFCLGNAFWVRPDWDEQKPVRITLRWKGFPGDWTLSHSFGTDQFRQTVRGSLEELVHGIYLGGDFRVRRIPVQGQPVHVAIRGEWSFTDGEFCSLVEKTIQLGRELWSDSGFRYYLVVLLPLDDPVGSIGGEGRTNSCVLFVPRGTRIDGSFNHIAVHEMVHAWIPTRIGRLESELLYWFSEGFTEYYTLLFRLRAGFVSLEEHIANWNHLLYRYYTSPVRHLTNEETLQQWGKNLKAMDLFYQRGCLLANNWNARIRAATGGRHSLDDVMRELMKTGRRRGAVISNSTILAAVGRYLEGAEEELQRYIEEGAVIPPRPDALGPCVALETLNLLLWELGYDGQVRRGELVSGVKPGSSAHQAGLRDGQEIIQSSGYAWDDPDYLIEMRVRDADGEKGIRFHPRGETVQIPQYRLKAGPCVPDH